MNSMLIELYISEHLYRRWENNRGEREISYQDSHYSGYSPEGALFTVIMATSVIGSREVPIIILKHVKQAVTV